MVDKEHPDVIKLLYHGSAEELVEYVQSSFAIYYSPKHLPKDATEEEMIKAMAEEAVDPLILRPRGRGPDWALFHLVRMSRSNGATMSAWTGPDLPTPPIILPGGKPERHEPRFPPEGYIQVEDESWDPPRSRLFCVAYTEDCSQLFHQALEVKASKPKPERGKPGPKPYPEDIWAARQIYEEHRPKREVKPEWLERVKANPKRTNLVDPDGQWKKISKPEWWGKLGEK